ncbi:MAG: OmpA family protein [Bdellovibrionota bacterium]
MKKVFIMVFTISLVCLVSVSSAQDRLPADNGIAKYHTEPRYRESESHPLRIVAYVVHPLGWALREGIIRPIDYLISSNETTKSIFGYREPYSFRKEAGCFSAHTDFSDCRKYAPYNYNKGSFITLAHNDEHDKIYADASDAFGANTCLDGNCNNLRGNLREVYMPDVNFDFDKKELNTLGKGKARVIANMLKEKLGVNVVLSGHADYIGSDTYNQKLGLDRAKALKDELVSLGVPSDRISTVSFGKERPVLGEKDAPARAVNRRVEVSF